MVQVSPLTLIILLIINEIRFPDFLLQIFSFYLSIFMLCYGNENEKKDPFKPNRYGDDALQTACLKGAHPIFVYLVETLNYSRKRLAEAYELLGSTFLDEHFDLNLTIKYWKQALEIRNEDPKNIIKKNILPPNAAFMNAKEFQTIDELNQIANDLDAMRMQSLIISERILGSTHKEMIYRLMYRGIIEIVIIDLFID